MAWYSNLCLNSAKGHKAQEKNQRTRLRKRHFKVQVDAACKPGRRSKMTMPIFFAGGIFIALEILSNFPDYCGSNIICDMQMQMQIHRP